MYISVSGIEEQALRSQHAPLGIHHGQVVYTLSISTVFYKTAGWWLSWCVDLLPDHPLKQVVDDEVGLGHHDEEGHVGPAKLKVGRGETHDSF